MNKFFPGLLLSLTIIFSHPSLAQTDRTITRIEFNSGRRGYREQIILTPDSIVSVQENFQTDKTPRVHSQKTTAREWSRLLDCLRNVRLTEIETLESPTMKRAYDGASHGSLIITVKDGTTYTHGFDDEDPHSKLKPLMEEIHKYRKGKR